MGRRVNIVVKDDILTVLKHIPAGERSRTINAALREWVQKRRRLDAVAEMDRLWAGTAAGPVTTAEIVRWIRSDRDGAQ